MSKLTGTLIFVTGVLSGSVGTYFALKKRFDILMEKEVESVKEAYERFNKKSEEPLRKIHDEYILNQGKDLPKEETAEEDKNEPEFTEPYLIPATEFNEVYGYETATLTLYSDGTVADEDMEIVEDVDEILGNENLELLKSGDSDAVYIRNDSKYCDYEVLRDYSSYEDAIIHQSIEEDYE